MWKQLWKQTLEKFELENCLWTDGKGRAIACCFRVKTKAADPPSVLINWEAIVPSRGETAFFEVRVTHVNSACNQNNSTEKEVPTKSFWKFHVVVVKNNGKEMYKKSVLPVQSCFSAN